MKKKFKSAVCIVLLIAIIATTLAGLINQFDSGVSIDTSVTNSYAVVDAATN